MIKTPKLAATPLTPNPAGLNLRDVTEGSSVGTIPNIGTRHEVTPPPAIPLSQVLRDPKPNGPSSSHPIDAGGSQGEPDVEFTYSTSDSPPKHLTPTQSRSNSIVPTRSRTSSVSTEHRPMQPPTMGVPPADTGITWDQMAETAERKESPPGLLSYRPSGSRTRAKSQGDTRDHRTKGVPDALKRSRSVSAASLDSIPRQDLEPLFIPRLVSADTPDARHRAGLNPSSIAENIEVNSQGWLGGILGRQSDACPPGSTPGTTPNFPEPPPSTNSPYPFHPITRDFKLDATSDSPPRCPLSLTQSRASSVSTERAPAQEQDSQRSTSLPPVGHGVTRDRTEAGERKEPPPGRDNSPQEVWNSMEGA